MDEPTLDCQGCGTVLRVLSAGEAQQVAWEPYSYVFYCRTCVAAGVYQDATYYDWRYDD